MLSPPRGTSERAISRTYGGVRLKGESEGEKGRSLERGVGEKKERAERRHTRREKGSFKSNRSVDF